jgi:hypothetical protein
MALRVLALAAAALIAPASTAVAASWSAPATLGPSGGSVIDPAIAFGSAAGPLISAGFRPEVGYSPGLPLQTVSRLFAGTTERAQVRLVAPPVAYGAARAAFLRRSPRDREFAPVMTLGVSLGDVVGNPGRFRLLSHLRSPTARRSRPTTRAWWRSCGPRRPGASMVVCGSQSGAPAGGLRGR